VFHGCLNKLPQAAHN